ncbi:hypothetical protein [Legionella sp. WA2022007384]
MQSKQSKSDSQRLISEIKQNLEDWKHSSMPPQYRQAKDELRKAIKLQVKQLEEDIEDVTKVDQAHKSLETLHSNTNKAQLLSNAVIMTYERTKDEKIDPGAVLSNAKNSMKIAWNLATGFAFDDSKSLKEKAIGFAKACIQGTIGMCQGALKGYEEGKGFFDTAAKMWAGSFDQGMKGYTKSLAMSTLDEQDRAKKIIEDIRAEHKKVLNDPDDKDLMKNARKKVIAAEEDYLKELEGKLSSSTSKEDLSKTVRSLEVLQLSNAATSLQSTGLSFLQRAVLAQNDTTKESNEAEKDTSKAENPSKVTPQVLEKLGKDTLNVTKNLNRILDDEKQSFPSKLWTMTKAYVNAGLEGIKSFFQSFEGKDLKEKSVNAVVGGFSSFMSKFSESLEKSNSKSESLEQSKTESLSLEEDDEPIDMTPLSTSNIGTVKEIPLIPQDSPSSSKEEVTKEDTLSMTTPHN